MMTGQHTIAEAEEKPKEKTFEFSKPRLNKGAI